MVMPKKDSRKGLGEAGGTSLEDVLVALQKSFSRVNALSNENRQKHKGQPTAQILGNVEFKMTLGVRPEADRLMVADGVGGPGKEVDEAGVDHSTDSFDRGIAQLTMKGVIDTDIAYDEPESQLDADGGE